MNRDAADITTSRLELRLLSAEDVESVFRYASDPDVAKNTAWLPHRTLRDASTYVDFVLSSHSEVEGALRHVWAIRLRGEPEAIGTIDLVQDSDERAHIDFALAKAYWNRGLITEASRAVLKWGFERLPTLQEIRSEGLSRNQGTMRVLEKLGFQLRAKTNVPRPPKFPDEALEAWHFSLWRKAFLASEEAGPRAT